MSWQESLGLGVASGVLIQLIAQLIVDVSRRLRRPERIPAALSRRVRRSRYLSAVLEESERQDTATLDVLAPRLLAAKGDATIRRIQRAWERINAREKVRVITLDDGECIQGGAELLKDDIEVRVARRDLSSESLSFHLFEAAPPGRATAIVNHRDGEQDRPVSLHGTAPTLVFRTHFEKLWERARPLESLIAQRVTAEAGPNCTRDAVLRSLNQAWAGLDLDPRCVERILPHLAFRHCSSVIFILGQPGAGKSYVRRHLARRLHGMRIESHSLTDYVFAYRDHLRAALKLDPARTTGFRAFDGGAFTVRDESILRPALSALAGAVRESVQENDVTLVEFARSDLVGALRVLDAANFPAQIIYVSSSPELRGERLRRRAVPPEDDIGGQSISIRLSDNHLLPSVAERTLYSLDGLHELKSAPRWRHHIFEIDNNVDDDGARVAAQLEEFTDRIVARYRAGHDLPPLSGRLAS